MVPNNGITDHAFDTPSEGEEGGVTGTENSRQSVLIHQTVNDKMKTWLSANSSPAPQVVLPGGSQDGPRTSSSRPQGIAPTLPTLSDMIEVRNHFFVIERLLEEEGLDTDSIKVRIKVIESMAAHTRMHAMDSNLISLPWEEFKINMCTPS
jgi:hypothetical protein